jgi:HTH-type transcriptional regulator / antitoxin HigA
MKAKIIKTEEEYEASLARIEQLMDAAPGSSQEDELALMALLVEKYEEEHYPINLPDPVEAIKFRMEQEGLSPKDLIPYIGSQSKVSEVLNHKRPLSITMIRALHDGLGIPAEVLVQEPYGASDGDLAVWEVYPFNEMLKRGYFPGFKGNLAQAKSQAVELLDELFSSFHGARFNSIYCKHTEQAINANALTAWQARATYLATGEKLPPFSPDNLSEDFFLEVPRLSNYTKGPQMMRELLNKAGIHFIILSHLPKTYLDGASFYAPDGHPVIALTLRYDRLDNFWFTVMHELAHLKLHMDQKDLAFFDDTERPARDLEQTEVEANTFTRDRLIPPKIWSKISDAVGTDGDEPSLISIAQKNKIHPAIVAGRVRWETQDFRRYTSLVGQGEVHPHFPECNG